MLIKFAWVLPFANRERRGLLPPNWVFFCGSARSWITPQHNLRGQVLSPPGLEKQIPHLFAPIHNNPYRGFAVPCLSCPPMGLARALAFKKMFPSISLSLHTSLFLRVSGHPSPPRAPRLKCAHLVCNGITPPLKGPMHEPCPRRM